MSIMRRGNIRVVNNTWPGFVDAMAALLLVLTFVLSIFMVVQSVLRDTIVSQDKVLSNLYIQISDLHNILEETEGKLIISEIESEDRRVTIATLNKSVQAAMQRISNFEEMVDKLLAEKLSLSKSLEVQTSDLAKKVTQLESAEEKILGLATKIDILNLEKSELENLLDFLKSDLIKNQNLLMTANTKITSFEEQVASLIAQKTGLRNYVSELEKEGEKNITRNEAARLALASARSEIDYEKENARLAAARAEALEIEVKKFKEKNLTSERQLEEIRIKLNEGDLALYAAQEDLMEVEFQKNILGTKLKDTVKALSELERQMLAEKIVISRLRESLEEEKEETSLLALSLAGERERAIELLSTLALIREEKGSLEEKSNQLDIEKRDLEELLAFREVLIREMEIDLIEEQKISSISSTRILELERDAKGLGVRLAELQTLLDESSKIDMAKNVQIELLGQNLNAALARAATEQKLRADMEEAERKRIEDEAIDLRNYRSEFFGEMKKIIKDLEGIQIVGDRFSFSSEVLFTSASAELGLNGKRQIQAVAEQLKKVTEKIPTDIKWILRVDGHTDSLPLISINQYKDNWELSQARALAVVKFLIEEVDFPPDKLAATGFGSYQPINLDRSPEAFSQNRRIELKITEK